MRIVAGLALEESEINAVNKNKSAQTGAVKTANAPVHAQTLLECQTQAVRLSWHRPYSIDIDDLHHVDVRCAKKVLHGHRQAYHDDLGVMTLHVHRVYYFYADLLYALDANLSAGDLNDSDLNALMYLNWQNDHAKAMHD